MTLDRVAHALLLRRVRFALLNVAAVGSLIVFIIAPFVSRVADKADEIAVRAELLARLRVVADEATQARMNTGRLDDLYLPGSEERLASADLQATLKTVADEAGLHFLSVRGVRPNRPLAPGMVTVGFELEGPPAALRTALQNIETGRPMLFVTALTLRPARDGNEGALRAELTVQGAMRDSATAVPVMEPDR
jgi:hypothetical protein